MVKVRGRELNVDILVELEEYEWTKKRISGDNLQACSPFRNERRPSFAVHLKTGVWIDSGSDSDEWKKGNFVALLSFLRNETREETEQYLLEKYASILVDVEKLELNLSLSLEEEKPRIISKEELKQYAARHPYLEKERRIPEEIQRQFWIGYCRKNKAITFPWHDKRGNVVNIKFRSTKSKLFWYLSGSQGGQPVRNHIYGLHMVYKKMARTVYLVESEIDALYLWAHGFPSIALGGASMSEKQKKLIMQSPIEKLLLATDNDRAGRKIRASIIEHLFGIIDLQEIRLPGTVKDVNELEPEQLAEVAGNPFDIELCFIA